MKTFWLAFLLTVGLQCAHPIADDQVPQSVVVKNSEIYVRYADSATERQLTSDGTPKASPALSKDRKRVAFVRNPAGNSLGTIVTMSVDGTLTREIAFRPTADGIAGMRFVDDLQWLSDHEIVLSGSVNPSTGEYAVVDIETGKQVRGYLVDGFSWVPSPDGSHVAYVGYVPHFIEEENRRPQLCIDDECGLDRPFKGYPPPSIHIEFSGKPTWSPKGTAVAITAENYETHVAVVIARPLSGKPVLFAPPGTGGSFELSWDREALIVRRQTRAWRLEPDSSEFRQIE